MLALLLTVDDQSKQYKQRLANLSDKTADLTRGDLQEYLKVLKQGNHLQQISEEIRLAAFKVLTETGGYVTMTETKEDGKIVETTIQMFATPDQPKLVVRKDIQSWINWSYDLPAGDIYLNREFVKSVQNRKIEQQ